MIMKAGNLSLNLICPKQNKEAFMFWKKRTFLGILFLFLGISSLLYGIHRNEHTTVAHKSNLICLECIGIG